MKQERSLEDFLSRCAYIKEQFEEFKKLVPDVSNDLSISNELITILVRSYFDDIDKLKEYHAKMKLTDHHKIAAYTAKWIVFTRPVQITNFTPKNYNNELGLLANELFALHCGLAAIGLKGFGDINKSLRYNLLYTFKYRHFTGRTLATIFYCIDQIHNQ